MSARLSGSLSALPFPIALLALWHAAVEFEWMTAVPNPIDTALATWDFAFGNLYGHNFSGTMLDHLLASTGRVLGGFALAAMFAVPLGVAIGRSPALARAMEPTLNLLRPVPVTAWVPLVLIVFGIGGGSTIILVTIAAFYPLLLNTIAGVRAVPGRLTEAASMLGTNRARTLWRVVLPAAMPQVLSGMRIAMGFAWVVVVVGETVGISVGLGATISNAREVSNTPIIIAGMAYIGLAGFATDKALVVLTRVLQRGRPLVAV